MSCAFVTLLTSDNYLPGALVLAKSLKKVGTVLPIVVLATKEYVSEVAGRILAAVFDEVIWVDAIHSLDFDNLKLLGRMELGITFTKIHCFNNLVLPYERIAYLDADTLILKNIDEIFNYVDEESVVFAASPDIGWPDCFNSGVFVTKPSPDLFARLSDMASTRGSFDGKRILCRW
jgi:alpha-N-acetylglucosamine transferase